jgi:phospholipase/carboxylesterase
MPLETITIETAPNPTAAVIILHGLGADGNDFAPIAHELDLASVGPVRFVLPSAPARPVTINGGYVMPAWYDILGPGRPEDATGLRASQKLVDALIGAEIARGIPAARIVLAGFSQGCAMTFMAGLRYGQRLAGLLGMSGYLPLAELTGAERSAANVGVPIFQAHGSADEMIPIARAIGSRDALIALGYPVEWHAYPMPHSVCPQEIVDMNRWLLRVLA